MTRTAILIALLFAPVLITAGEETGPLWDAQCQEVADGAPSDCTMSQIVFIQETNQMLVRVSVRVHTEDRSPAMMLLLPHGIFIPQGVQLSIDGEPWQRVVFQTTGANGVFAGVPMDEEAVARLESGQRMEVTVVSLQRQPVTIPVNLTGFAEVLAEIL